MRLECYRLSIVRNSNLATTKRLVSKRNVVMECRNPAVQADRFPDKIYRRVALAALVGGNAQQMQRIDMTWMRPQDIPVSALRCVEPAGFVQSDGIIKCSFDVGRHGHGLNGRSRTHAGVIFNQSSMCDNDSHSRRSDTSVTVWLASLVRMRCARRRVGKMFSRRLSRLIRVQIEVAVSTASASVSREYRWK